MRDGLIYFLGSLFFILLILLVIVNHGEKREFTDDCDDIREAVKEEIDNERFQNAVNGDEYNERGIKYVDSCLIHIND